MLVLIVLLLTAPASSADDICVGLANDTQCATMHGYNMQPRPAVNRSNSVTFDLKGSILKEEYYNNQTKEVEETKWEEKKVLLYENEVKEINLTSDSLNIHPRRMYVWYNQTGYLYAAVEAVQFIAANTTVNQTVCDCYFVEMMGYLSNDDSRRVVYAKNWTKTLGDGNMVVHSDIVTVTRLARDVPLSNSPDKECFDWQVGEGYLPGADLEKNYTIFETVTVNLTKMVYSERGSSDNATHHNMDTRIVTLTEGKREYVQLTYTNHTSDGFRYINPRNITLLFRGSYVYAGMAILFDQVSGGDNNESTSRRSVIACEDRYDMDSNAPYDYVDILMTWSDRSWSDPKRLDYYVFESHVHPDMDVWRDGEYLLLSVSSAGTWSLQLATVLGIISLFLGN